MSTGGRRAERRGVDERVSSIRDEDALERLRAEGGVPRFLGGWASSLEGEADMGVVCSLVASRAEGGKKSEQWLEAERELGRDALSLNCKAS